jgi:hypothetical protein
MAIQSPEMSPVPAAARYTVAPGIMSQITLKTLPHAACTLRAEDETNPDRQMKLYADDDGLIRFCVRPSREEEIVARFVIDCEAERKVTRYPLELRPHSKPTAEMPHPPTEPLKEHQAGARVRPALLGDELLRLSDKELVNRGYPIRPNPEQAPGAFNTWRRAVSTPTTVIEPRQVARPDIIRTWPPVVKPLPPLPPLPPPGGGITPEPSDNWSGFQLNYGPGAFDLVTGTWVVPSVTGKSDKHMYSSCWVGLDGYPFEPGYLPPTFDLVQAGTTQQVLEYLGSIFTFTSYFAWTQLLPNQTYSQQITNFNVHHGDEIFAEVWIGNVDSGPTLQGALGIFFLENLTRSRSTAIATPLGDTQVAGWEAEWIVERPAVNKSTNLSDLPDYHSINMSAAFARLTSNGVYLPYLTNVDNQSYQYLLQFTMVNDPHVLSTVTPVTYDSMRFDWKNFL